MHESSLPGRVSVLGSQAPLRVATAHGFANPGAEPMRGRWTRTSPRMLAHAPRHRSLQWNDAGAPRRVQPDGNIINRSRTTGVATGMSLQAQDRMTVAGERNDQVRSPPPASHDVDCRVACPPIRVRA